MHEFAVCQALLDQVGRVAADHGDATVIRITVSAGPLSGVVPELLERAFTLARAGGPAAAAELVVETPAVRVRCRSCGAESDATVSRLVCGQCGDFHTVLLEGDELILKRVELMEPEHDAGSRPARENVRHGNQENSQESDYV
jgi:hydrogenase nickel incorporation protein HypA/HybF